MDKGSISELEQALRTVKHLSALVAGLTIDLREARAELDRCIALAYRPEGEVSMDTETTETETTTTSAPDGTTVEHEETETTTTKEG